MEGQKGYPTNPILKSEGVEVMPHPARLKKDPQWRGHMAVQGDPSQMSRVLVGLWVLWHVGVVKQGVSGLGGKGQGLESRHGHIERARLSRRVWRARQAGQSPEQEEADSVSADSLQQPIPSSGLSVLICTYS